MMYNVSEYIRDVQVYKKIEKRLSRNRCVYIILSIFYSKVFITQQWVNSNTYILHIRTVDKPSHRPVIRLANRKNIITYTYLKR